jgi:hypothetical protein
LAAHKSGPAQLPEDRLEEFDRHSLRLSEFVGGHRPGLRGGELRRCTEGVVDPG